MTDIDDLLADHAAGVLTAELLLAAKPAPSISRLQAEILRLERLITATPPGRQHDLLCAAFRALNWARSPDSFVPPSQEN